jgi:hypothetical protein
VTGWSLVQRSPTECGVSKCVIVKPRKMRRPRPPRGCRAIREREKKISRCEVLRVEWLCCGSYVGVSLTRIFVIGLAIDLICC